MVQTSKRGPQKFQNFYIWWSSFLLPWKRGSGRKNFDTFLLSMTHSTVWAKTIVLALHFKNKSYPCGVSRRVTVRLCLQELEWTTRMHSLLPFLCRSWASTTWTKQPRWYVSLHSPVPLTNILWIFDSIAFVYHNLYLEIIRKV